MVNLLAVQDNGEWQLLTASAERNVVVYDCCPEPYIDITATIFLRSPFVQVKNHSSTFLK